MDNKPPEKGYNRLRAIVFDAPFNAGALLLKLFYGFRVDGLENIPPEGPYIVWLTEPNLIGMALSGFIAIKVLHKQMATARNNNVSYMQEELFRFEFFKKALKNPEDSASAAGNYRPLVPHSAGQLALGLVDGYRVLMNKGIVVINPEGDAPYDGRPLPLGRSLAWLALRTAAQIVPIFTPIGAYDVWPRWQRGLSRKGKIAIAVSKPFRICDEPLEQVRPDDLARADARLRQEFEKRYGPGGVSGWAGPTLRNGVPVADPVTLKPPATPPDAVPPVDPAVKSTTRGVAQLLWQCPVCRTDEALVHRRRRGWPQTVSCQACRTRWELQRIIEHDFRMKVVEGPPELIGLDMALTAWYDEMRRNFRPKPIRVPGLALPADEEVYLEKGGVPLMPYKPNPLFEGWNEREPPKKQVGRHEWADWESIGEGQLVLTSHRLLWRGPDRELDFMWSSVSAISLYMATVLGIRYGAAMYRFELGNVLPLRWLQTASYAAKKVAQADGHLLTVSYE